MPLIDEFASDLLEEAKRFLEKASEATEQQAITANLHAALMLAFSALEAHVNAICDEVADRPGITVHEKAFLLEREARLIDGEFVAKQTLRMSRLDDRIQFLHRRFSGKAVDRTEAWWGELQQAIALRNELTHPKAVPSITTQNTERSIQSVVDVLNEVYLQVYSRKFPAFNRGVRSRLNF